MKNRWGDEVGDVSVNRWGDPIEYSPTATAVADTPVATATVEPEQSGDGWDEMYASIKANEEEAARLGISVYELNLQKGAAAEQENNPKSAVRRIAETGIDAFTGVAVDPLLKLEGALGSETADIARGNRQFQQDVRGLQSSGWLESTISGVVDSVATSATAASLGGLPAILGTIGNKSYDQAFRQARRGGANESEARKIAMANGAIEVGVTAAFQMAGLGGLEQQVLNGAKWKGVKALAKQVAAEVTEEEITTLGQNLASRGDVGKPQDYVDTAIQSILAMGVVGGSQKAINFVNSPSRSNARKLGLGETSANYREFLSENAKTVMPEDSIVDGQATVTSVKDAEQTQEQQAEALTADPQTQERQGEPPIADGMVRLYHGGTTDGGGPRWVTPDRAYAEGYGQKNANATGVGIGYIDLPLDHPQLKKAFDDTGTSATAPFLPFELSEAEASGINWFTKARKPAPPAPEPTPATTVESEAPQPEVAPETPTDALTQRFRGLANHAIDPVARQANYEVDVEMGKPEHQPQVEAITRASQRVTADPDGERARIMSMIEAAEKSDGTIDLSNLDDTVVASQLIEAAAIEGYANDSPEARVLHRRMQRAYRNARTGISRALSYRDPVARLKSPQDRMKRAITDAMTVETKAEIEARKEAKTPEDHAKIDKAQEERYQAIKKELEDAGIDIQNMDSWIGDKDKMAFVLDKFNTNDSTLFDKMFEYWRNSILSGPRTHATNVLGNVGFGTYSMLVERPVEAAVNLFVKNPRNAQIGELGPMLKAAIPAMKEGLKNAKFAWTTERSILAMKLGKEELFKYESKQKAIKGKVGRAIRVPFRMLAFADEFAKTVTSSMEITVESYRQAKREGLDPKSVEFQQRMEQLTSDTGSEAWDIAYQKALDLAFQGNHGLLATGVSKVGKGLRKLPVIGKPLHYVIAFVDTPASILEQGVKRTAVFGDLLEVMEYANNRRAGKDVVEPGMTPILARRLLAWGAMVALWDLVDDEEPIITGAAYTPEEKATLYRTGMQPQSIRIGNNSYSYARLEPFATYFALTVDTIRGIKKGKPLETPLIGLMRQVESKSYMEGLGDTLKVLDKLREGDVSGISEWASKFAGSWAPNIYRSTASAGSGEVPEKGVWGKGTERTTRILRRTAEMAQLPFTDPKPRYDVWGRKITYSSHIDAPLTSFVWNLVSPVNVKSLDDAQKMDLALMRYREQHPESTLSWREPRPYFEYQGKTIYLSDDEYAEYLEEAGSVALRLASARTVNVNNPTEQQIKNIKTVIQAAHRSVRTRLKPKWLKARQ